MAGLTSQESLGLKNQRFGQVDTVGFTGNEKLVTLATPGPGAAMLVVKVTAVSPKLPLVRTIDTNKLAPLLSTVYLL
jgi:hypothetical protein